MVNFGYPYNDIVICKDSTDYLDIDVIFYRCLQNYIVYLIMSILYLIMAFVHTGNVFKN